jgi:hypothetical protein
MKKAPIFIILLLLVFSSCSKEEEFINESSADYSNQELFKSPPSKVTFTGSPDFTLRAMIRSNGVVNGRIRTSYGERISIDCIRIIETSDTKMAVVSGFVSSNGVNNGQPRIVILGDNGPTGDQATDIMPASGIDCNINDELLILFLETYGFPTTTGQVTISL